MQRVFLHAPALAVLCACGVMLTCTIPAMSADYTVPGTSLRLPDNFAGFTRGEAHTYSPDKTASGTAVAYHSDSAEATFFIRPLDPKDNLNTAEDLVNDTFLAIDEMQERGIYSEVKKFKGSEPAGSLWTSGAFIAKRENTLITSYIHCRISEGRSVKIRLTSPNVKDAESHMKFIKELRALIDAALKSP